MKQYVNSTLGGLIKLLGSPHSYHVTIIASSAVAIPLVLMLCIASNIQIKTNYSENIAVTSETTIPTTTPTKWWIKTTPTSSSSRPKSATPMRPVELFENNCAPTNSSLLKPGIFAYISLTPPLPNRLRSGAGQEYYYLGQIGPGRGVKILDGPICADSLVWWLVASATGELRGWTPEGRNSEQWVRPCPNQAVACDKTPLSTPTSPVAKDNNEAKDNMCWSEKLTTGTSAQVGQGNLLVIRLEPNGGEVVGRAGPLSVVDIVDGPTCAGDAIWFKVNITALNLSGWATENNLYACSKEARCN